MTVQELIDLLECRDKDAKVKVIIGSADGVSLEEFEYIGSSEDGEEIWIPINFDAVCTHEENREFLN